MLLLYHTVHAHKDMKRKPGLFGAGYHSSPGTGSHDSCSSLEQTTLTPYHKPHKSQPIAAVIQSLGSHQSTLVWAWMSSSSCIDITHSVHTPKVWDGCRITVVGMLFKKGRTVQEDTGVTHCPRSEI